MAESFVAGNDLESDGARPHADGRAIGLMPTWRRRALSRRRAVFLDRDGTINEMVYDRDHGLVDSPVRPDQLRLLPGAAQAIRRINAMGLLAIIVSNQPGIAKGKTSLMLLEATTVRLQAELAMQAGAVLDGVYYCLHHPEGTVAPYCQPCSCRKPGPGLLFQAAHRFGIDLERSYMIGDGLNDIAAGRRAGCRTTWLGRARSDWVRVAVDEGVPEPDWTAGSLAEAVETIALLEQRGEATDGDLRGLGGPGRDQAVGRVRSRRWRDDEPVHHAEVRSP